MPSESMTIAVTSGLGIGIIAGIVSGVCYILVHGLSTHRPSSNRAQWHCGVCGDKFRSIEGILETDKVVTCSKCRKKVCRKKCSYEEHSLWVCQVCQQPESWFKGILKSINPNHAVLDSNLEAGMDIGKIEEVAEDLELIKKKEKAQVREFIERLVEAMLGDGIDHVSVTHLYNDQQYDTLMNTFHRDLSSSLTDLGSALHMSIANLPIVGQSPCSAHADLKVLIQRIIQEAIGLSSMKKLSNGTNKESNINNRTYEDLLATAIINKVVQNYQEEIPTSSANSSSSKHSNSSVPNKEYFFGEETLDTKWKKSNSTAGDLDTASVSSLEEWVRSDSSTGSTKYVDHRSLTIKQEIQEESSSDEEVVHVKHKRTNWKENWTLQKRQFTSSPIPVPMLVPNPTSDAKVLIGDREAEDTTDLSDVGSEYGDTEKAPAIETLLVDSKTVIGGKNCINSVIQQDVQSDGSIDASNLLEETEQLRINHKETHLQNADLSSFDSHVEQDSEYTEKYATLPKTIVKESITSGDLQNANNSSSQLVNGTVEHKASDVSTEEIQPDECDAIAEDQFKGSYSAREKQKWENAVEMKNNPYTEENIKKRLTKSSFTDVSSLFGRDYYVKEASKAAGARKLKAEDKTDEVTPKMQHTESNGVIYQAVPALVDTHDSLHSETNSPLVVSPTPSNLLEISSDSDLSIERVYNVNSGKVYETVGGTHKEVRRSITPDALISTTNLNQTITLTDENHNKTTVEQKRSFLKSLTDTEESEQQKYIEPEAQESPTYDNVFSDSSVEHENSQILENTYVESHITNENEHVVVNKIISENNAKYSIQEFSLEFSTDGESSLNVNSDPEITDLKDKHLVKDKLGIFSKSHSHAATPPTMKISIHAEDSFVEQTSTPESPIQELQLIDTSVNDLKKRFDNDKHNEDFTKKQMHSLTARSISQTIRKELQEVNDNVKETVSENSVTQEVVDEEEEKNYFPNAKSRIKFFENLNR